MNKLRIAILFPILILSLTGGGCSKTIENEANSRLLIDQDLSFQVKCGPRVPGSACHQKIQDWIISSLNEYHWQVEPQPFFYGSLSGTNIRAQYGTGEGLILIGAHYDSRFTSDQEAQADLRSQPVPGANDGASGVALLLHLAREIPHRIHEGQKTIWLVFFDLEDNGNYPGWDWILGSTAFANNLSSTPEAVVVVDMIGDKDLNLHYERNSSVELNQAIWNTAHRLGYEKHFSTEFKYRMIDDHLPFVQRGIPTALLIDFDYPYWHTTQDTLDKVSSESIYIVYDTLIHWLEESDN